MVAAQGRPPLCILAAIRSPSIWERRPRRRPIANAAVNSIPTSRRYAELLQQNSSATAPVLAQRLQTLGYTGGITILKDYLQAARKSAATRRAYVRMEPGPGERFDIDWGHFGALLYNGTPRKLIRVLPGGMP